MATFGYGMPGWPGHFDTHAINDPRRRTVPLTPTAWQSFMLGLITEARATAGLRALALDAELTTAAQGHAQWVTTPPR